MSINFESPCFDRGHKMTTVHVKETRDLTVDEAMMLMLVGVCSLGLMLPLIFFYMCFATRMKRPVAIFCKRCGHQVYQRERTRS